MPEVNVDYTPPKTLDRFLRSQAFVRTVVGPVGSGKSSASVIEILRRAVQQAPGPDGIRRTRFAVIRNTYGQLRDTTRKTFEQWIPDALGRWREQEFTFEMKFGDVHCEVLFRALDRPEDVKKLLSLELTGAYINEVREVPKHVLDVLQTRVGRYPSKIQGGPTWYGIWADTNPWHSGHWVAKLFNQGLADYKVFRQPGGRDPDVENIENLPDGYYRRLVAGKDSEWVKVYVDGQDASSDVGSVWGPWIAELEKRGGISAFSHPNDGVFASFDLGHSDATGIWFWRINSHGVPDIIDHYENHGEGPSHYFAVLDAKGYDYAKIWLPHDARHKTFATQVTALDQFIERYGAGKVAITPQLSIADGLAAARWMLEQPMRIHERCGAIGRLGHSGLDALRDYRFDWDEENQCFSRTPVHNFASHSADAFRYVALVVKFSDLMTKKPDPASLGVNVSPPTVSEAFKLSQRYRRQSRRWSND